MANDVYTQTHHGLTTLMSARAAQRVLDRALQTAGYTADTVSGGLMRNLLLGPVCRELETTLPRDGLRRTLKKLVTDLTAAEADHARSLGEPTGETATTPNNPPETRQVKADEEAARVPAPASPRAPASRKEPRRALQDEPDKAPRDSFAPFSTPEDEHVTAPVAAYSAPSQLPQPYQPSTQAPAAFSKPAPQRKAFPPLSHAQLETIVLRFAGLEEVKLVASFGPGGEVTGSRGGGFDLGALARYGLMTLTLLRRSGHVRSYYLAHSLYQLFLLPLGGSTLVVIGTPELNVGSVFGTLSTLEEEL